MAKLINLQAFKKFFRSGQIGGIILLFAVVISLIIANSPLNEPFHDFLSIKLGRDFGPVHLTYPVELWINDGLMAVFFLLVGLEIKREILEGELSSAKKAAMPVFAAIGGMLVPAAIYAIVNKGEPTASGWGIPMATDIAFALAVISLLGNKVPTSLKVFLAALAIVDDLGAILVIAIFYTKELHTAYLLYSGGIVILLAVMNKAGIKNLFCYLVPGVILWYCIHHSGIHATIAGVLLAFTIPTNEGDTESPLEKLEHFLNNPVNFFIMPLFALANTAIRFEAGMADGLLAPMGIGIIGGLVLGKTIGISLFSYLSVKLGLSSLPSRSTWKHIIGLGLLGGIGFTMSIFISLLSFSDVAHQSEAKFSILVASVLAGGLGYIYLSTLDKRVQRKKRQHIS